ncbi:hypothetical protein JW968_02380 [Candidatus Woesearchaeota archaeon]|nr:hypothetical protein [Candidatus Woesearchaeota archaeon]
MIENARSPTLRTVKMIEETIERYSGELNRRQLWEKLPKKVMWQTYLEAINHLQKSFRIGIDRNGTIGWIWNPKLAERTLSRPDLRAR